MPELLAAIDAFMQEHRRCGELNGGVDGERVNVDRYGRCKTAAEAAGYVRQRCEDLEPLPRRLRLSADAQKRAPLSQNALER